MFQIFSLPLCFLSSCTILAGLYAGIDCTRKCT
jgi:hypothetical protein